MKPQYPHVLHALTTMQWAILPESLQTICGIIEARANGGPSLSKDEVRAVMGAPAAAQPSLLGGGAVAVIPLSGCLAPKMNLFAEFSGGTSLAQFRKQIATAAADATVKAIIVAIDSQGGSVVGCEETWNVVKAASKSKPVIGSVDALMASAALWVASACDEIDITPSGEAGALGVFCVHTDVSKAAEAAGVKVTYIRADISPFKAEGNPHEPLTEEVHSAFKGRVNDWAGTFLSQVAKGRKLSESVVEKTFGRGRPLSAKDAVDVKMVDRIATFDETLARVLASKPVTGLRAEGTDAAGPESFAALVSGSPAPSAETPDEEYDEDDTCPECKGSGLKPERSMGDPQGQEKCEACDGSGKRKAASDEATDDDAALADEHAILAALSN